jgi:YHS domain-containing protein
MRILFWIIRIVGLLLLIRIVLRMLFPNRGAATRAGGGFRRGRPASGRDAKPGGELVRDPHCGTYVPKVRALAVAAGTETHYFCSATCRDAYRAKASA